MAGRGRPRLDVPTGGTLAVRLSEDARGWVRATAIERGESESRVIVRLIEDARRREMETIYRVVPAGTRDVYAAGEDANRFATMEEAETAIASLRAMGGEWDHEWDVIEVEG